MHLAEHPMPVLCNTLSKILTSHFASVGQVRAVSPTFPLVQLHFFGFFSRMLSLALMVYSESFCVLHFLGLYYWLLNLKSLSWFLAILKIPPPTSLKINIHACLYMYFYTHEKHVYKFGSSISDSIFICTCLLKHNPTNKTMRFQLECFLLHSVWHHENCTGRTTTSDFQSERVEWTDNHREFSAHTNCMVVGQAEL